MRTLVVAERWPWPQDHGAAMRLANAVAAFADLGDVEMFVLPESTADARAEAEVPLARVGVAGRPGGKLTVRRRIAWLATGRLPLELWRRDYTAVRHAFAEWSGSPYDLAWFGDAEVFVALGPLVRAPAIVDFDDLEDQAAWLKKAGRTPGERPLVDRVADLERRLRQSKNARQWRALRARAAEATVALAVSSEQDRIASGRPEAVVVPNGYPPPPRPLGREAVGALPRILLAGYLRYGPNIDAARHLVEEVGPRLRRRAPEAQIRLVGLGDARTAALHAPPAVVVTGWVEDMSVELGRADVVAVPLRHAGGTRIKILEAFAHHLPVVSTTIGAHGLEVRDGEHLLLRDDPAAFADACADLLEDEALRHSLTTAAASLFHARYRWDDIRCRLGLLGAAVAAGQPVPQER